MSLLGEVEKHVYRDIEGILTDQSATEARKRFVPNG